MQYTFDKPYTINESRVYWLDFEHYDYTCKPPSEWKLEYKKGSKWYPVENLTSYTVNLNLYNIVEFNPVRTKAIRIKAKLNKDISSGILEWKVN